jgi:NAD dependent epimerase/dehydratase family enzyme
LLLNSQRLSAQKLLASGYTFVHPTLTRAAAWVVGRD